MSSKNLLLHQAANTPVIIITEHLTVYTVILSDICMGTECMGTECMGTKFMGTECMLLKVKRLNV